MGVSGGEREAFLSPFGLECIAKVCMQSCVSVWDSKKGSYFQSLGRVFKDFLPLYDSLWMDPDVVNVCQLVVTV